VAELLETLANRNRLEVALVGSLDLLAGRGVGLPRGGMEREPPVEVVDRRQRLEHVQSGVQAGRAQDVEELAVGVRQRQGELVVALVCGEGGDLRGIAPGQRFQETADLLVAERLLVSEQRQAPSEALEV